MKKYVIRITEDLLKKVHAEVLSTGANESVAFLTARHFDTGEKVVFLANTMVDARPTDYLSQGPLHLQISPMYVNRVLNVAEGQRDTVIMVHSHPFEKQIPWYSPTDDYGEAQTSETISKCLEGNPPVGSLLFGQTHVTGRGWTGLTQKKAACTVAVMKGMSFQFHLPRSDEKKESFSRDILDRQIKVLGGRLQTILEALDIGIIGLGGTGSVVAEQLARMGVRKLRLVDHDRVDPSNLSRLYGGTPNDAKKKKYKVDVVSSHLAKINPQIETVNIADTVVRQDVLKCLANCDVIFSCLDRHAPRAVLNELSYQCFVPVIDVGVGLQREHAGVIGGCARATLIGPGLPCLLCHDIVRPEVIMAENLSPEEYEARRADGYVAGLQQNVPSVINFTTLAGSLGVSMFLDAILSQAPKTYSTLLYDISSKEMLQLSGKIREECVCQKRRGSGLNLPFSVAD